MSKVSLVVTFSQCQSDSRLKGVNIHTEARASKACRMFCTTLEADSSFLSECFIVSLPFREIWISI